MRRIVWALTGLVIFFPCALFLTAAGAAEPNLVACWTFDEGTGVTAYDSSGNSCNGTISGATWFNDLVRGWSLSFNGSSNYVNIPNNTALNITGDITISAWVYLAAGSTTKSIVAKTVGNGATNNPFDFRTEGTSLTLVRADAAGHEVCYSTTAMSTQQWHHILVRVENKVPDFYLDGVITGKTITAFTKNPTGNTNPLYVGRRADGLYFNGLIDEVRIYNRALTIEEITQLFFQSPALTKAYNPNPANNLSSLNPADIVLSWKPGNRVVWHDIYLGTDFNDVNDANTTTPGLYKGAADVNYYDPCTLQRDTKYYWRIDEVNDGNICKGDVWNFATTPIWKYDFIFPNDPFTSNVIFQSDPRWVKFTIKLDDPCTIYYQDCKIYQYHYDFASQWLEPFIGMTIQQFDNVTLFDANQLAVMGAIILPPMTGSPPTPTFNEYAIQFIGFDPYTKEEIAFMFNAVRNSVIADPCVVAVYFPTYEQQQVATENKIWFESQGIIVDSINRWIPGNICYSKGWAIGRLKYVPGDQIQSAYINGQLLPDDILMTDGVPAEVPYVAGIISLSPSTPNSHVAILSSTYGIPFVYLANTADVSNAWQLVNKLTFVCVQESSGVCSVQLTDAMAQYTSDEIAEMLAMKTPGTLDISPIVPYGSYDADANNLLPKDINQFGGKASNYGMLRTSIPGNSPRAAAISFDLWNVFLDQPLTPCTSTIIEPGGYVLFWADSQPSQGVRHADFKLSKTGEAIGLTDRDGTLIDAITFGVQIQDVSYGRTPDGNNTWTVFSGTDVTPNVSNLGGGEKPTQGLFINEFMAENKTSITDEFSEHDDWIEIYNAGPTPVDLGGMYLTDDLSNPTKWMIPVGLTGNTLRAEIANRLSGFSFPPSNLAALSVQLAAIRNIIINPNITHFTQQQQDSLIAMLQDPNYGFNPNKLIRFRSSTNVEDSDKFSGAGLYDSYSGCLADDLDTDSNGPCLCDPNETAERGAFRAIRKVLASFYNDNAYLERMRHDVNEHNVGMAMLVHHSFPDDIELANGVATMERTSGQSFWNIKLVTQKGAVSVTNPADVRQTPEEVSVYADRSGGLSMTLMRQSNLVILGETVMQWQDDYNDLVGLLVTAAQRFEQVTGKTDYILDFEYKKVAPGGAALPAGGIDVDQIRQIPRIAAAELSCPSFSYCGDIGGLVLVEQHYEDSTVSIDIAAYFSCVWDCFNYDFSRYCRVVIRGYTSRPLILHTGYAQKAIWGMNHWYWPDFYFTPFQEPGIDQCLLNQLHVRGIGTIHFHDSWDGTYVETSPLGIGSGPSHLGDIQFDGNVDMLDFARFAQKWLYNNCGYCGGADFDCDKEVSIEDLEVMIDNWLK